MSKSVNICFTILLLASLLAVSGFAQISETTQKNPTIYPYGGSPDSSRFESSMEKVPLTFQTADFRFARFNQANFRNAKFSGKVDFRYAEFQNRADFWGAEFNNVADFRFAQFKIPADFDRAVIRDKFYIGSRQGQEFDFTRTIFFSPAKLVLCEFVEINFQYEKIEYITLLDTLSYNLKRLIIDNLKQKSFKNDSKAHFELEYVFAKATMYQSTGDKYIKNRWYQVWNLPGAMVSNFYYLTMGLGYRPFRLVWWVIAIIFLFSFWYFTSMRDPVSRYLIANDKEKEQDSHAFDQFINCLFFSTSLFFTFRLKKEILKSFERKQRWIIIFEYLIGFLVYIAFLTLAKSGSIIHNLKSLFMG